MVSLLSSFIVIVPFMFILRFIKHVEYTYHLQNLTKMCFEMSIVNASLHSPHTPRCESDMNGLHASWPAV